MITQAPASPAGQMTTALSIPSFPYVGHKDKEGFGTYSRGHMSSSKMVEGNFNGEIWRRGCLVEGGVYLGVVVFFSFGEKYRRKISVAKSRLEAVGFGITGVGFSSFLRRARVWPREPGIRNRPPWKKVFDFFSTRFVQTPYRIVASRFAFHNSSDNNSGFPKQNKCVFLRFSFGRGTSDNETDELTKGILFFSLFPFGRKSNQFLPDE